MREDTVTAEELIAHPSVQREIALIRKLGGDVTVQENNVVIHRGIIPVDVAIAFMDRINVLDANKQLHVSVGA
ncbi:MAG: hypothetical protein HYT93_03995 [Parcubacteria group bacterium]|nr:hypothetical protein [Parcubacteria group bacterium]